MGLARQDRFDLNLAPFQYLSVVMFSAQAAQLLSRALAACRLARMFVDRC
jgi:hypothetical protein